jgi:hypothetical protein
MHFSYLLNKLGFTHVCQDEGNSEQNGDFRKHQG